MPHHHTTRPSSRYTGPSAQALALQLPGSSSRSDGQGRWRLRGWCHGRGESRSSASLVVSDRPEGGLSVRCWAGCDRRTIIEALEQASGLKIWDSWDSTIYSERRFPAPARLTTDHATPDKPQKPAPDALPWALRLWAEAVPVPIDPEHPARRWLANRSLYWQELPMPRAIRWRPATSPSDHGGTGALVSLWAAPMQWTAAWPDLPTPEAVELIHIDEAGNPALDRPETEGGLPKRTYGPRGGTICVLGDPRPGTSQGLALGEGLADGLALAARDLATAVACGGTSGLASPGLITWCTSFRTVKLWADVDAAGIEAARKLRIALAYAGRDLNIRILPAGLKDPAVAAAATPLQPLDLPLVREIAAEIVSGDGLPLWEAARIAALTT